MPDCDYCGDSFSSEKAELKHLKSEHRDELGPIDKRRVGDVDLGDDGLPVGPIALGVVILSSVAIVAYVILIAGSGTGGATYNAQAHSHGTLFMSIDDDVVDFHDEQFIENDRIFHFHGEQSEPLDDGSFLWHVHGTSVTIQYALETLGIQVNDDGTVIEFAGESYDDSDADTDVSITVDDNPVEPAEFVISDGNVGVGEARGGQGYDIEIIIETE